MRPLIRLLAITGITIRSQLAYGRDVAIRSSFMVVVLAVFAQLWITTYQLTGSAIIAGFSLPDLVWYLVLTETVVLSAPRVSQTIDNEVKVGDVAYRLARPVHYLSHHLAAYWGEAAVRAPINLAIGGLVALVMVGPPPLTPLGLPAALLALTLGLTLNFVIEALIGLTAFWVEETQPFYWIYQKLLFTVGGLFLPLDLFPDWLAALARLLPFAAITYAPARLFVDFSLASFVALVAGQLVWLAVLGGGLIVLFGVATREVQTHGG